MKSTFKHAILFNTQPVFLQTALKLSARSALCTWGIISLSAPLIAHADNIPGDPLFPGIPMADPGLPGPQGPQGPPGPPGPPGAPGLMGAAGAQGPSGAVGNRGPVGARGPAGATGAVGPRGSIGARGPAGAAGPQGPAGTDGARGPQGSQGPSGPTGVQGPIGIRGPAGPRGSVGNVGPRGQAGAQGPAGADGAAGPQGPAGADGAQGPVGPAGPQGPPGITPEQVNILTNEITIIQNTLGEVSDINILNIPTVAGVSQSVNSPPTIVDGINRNTDNIETNRTAISQNAVNILSNSQRIEGFENQIQEFGTAIAVNSEEIRDLTAGLAAVVSIPDIYLESGEKIAISGGIGAYGSEVGFGTTFAIRGNENWTFGASLGHGAGQTTGKVQFRWGR